MITLKQLQTFHSICRVGGFAAAAERINSTQTAVSMRIRELEESLGVRLFDRTQRSAKLTPKGRQLLRHAEQIIAMVSEIEAAVADPHAVTGTIRLGASDFVAVTWLPKLISAIHAEYPNLTLELDVDLGPNVFKKLEAGEVEAAILPGPVPGAGFSQIYLGSVEFAWMASPTLKIPKRLTAKDLSNWPLLSLPRHSNSYRILDRWFEENGAEMKRTHVCNNLQVLMSLTRAGLGISHLPVQYLKSDIKDRALVVLDVGPSLPQLEYYAVYERGQASTSAKRIVEMARAYSEFKSSPLAGKRKTNQK